MFLNSPSFNKVNAVETDFRAEVIAAEMIEEETSLDRILIVPLGAFKRHHSKDIEGIEAEVSDYDNKEYIVIKTPKEGLYDKLPEGLFHTSISYAGNNLSEQEVIEAIKRHRREEKAARTFFLPLDASLNNVRVQIALYENQLDKKFHFSQLVSIFSKHWQIFEYLNVLQANIFLQFLPVIHSMRDDWKAIETLFELMLLTPARLQMRNQRKYIGTDEKSATLAGLGEGVLGVDVTTGDYVDGGEFVEMLITLGPMTAEQVGSFTGTLQQEKVVLLLCDFLLPADLDIVIEYDLMKNERSFYLSEKGAIGNNCEMGVSTYL